MARKRTLERAIAGLLVVALALSMAPLAAVSAIVTDPVINEFVFNHTGTDTEAFIEVFGDPSTDYSAFTLLEIEGDGDDAGIIDAVLPVGMTDAGGFWLDDEDVENGTVTLLLVEGFSGSLSTDLDADNDGTLDATPWGELVDAVAVNDGGSSDLTYGEPVLGVSYDGLPYAPGGASRIPNGTDTDTSSDWVRNDFDLAGIPGFPGTPEVGEALNTPGAVNELVEISASDPVINEFVFNHTGTDTEAFIEVFGDPSTDYSAFTLLEIEGDGDDAGIIDAVLPVGMTDAGGFWLDDEDVENGTVTLLLVEGFSGSLSTDLDADNDGTLDATPWGELVDAVAVNDGGSSDLTYGEPVLGVSYDGLPYAPGGASRIPNGTDTDTSSDWVRNDFDLAGIPGFPGTPEAGEALNTPGAVNELVEISAGDPVINEFVFNHTGTDTEAFIEVFGDPSTDYSAFTLLEIEGDGDDAGIIDAVLPVGMTDAGGFWLDDEDVENGTVTLLLVEGFSGSLSTDLDADNDGTLDATPWGELVDAVAVNDGGSSDLTYGVPVLTAYYDGLPYTPGGASRIPDGFDTDAATDWVRNDYDLAGIEGYPGTIALGEAYNTPGAPNEIYVPPPEQCGDDYTHIYTIQGSGFASDLDGDVVSTEGIVVGDFQDGKSGYFIQDVTGDGSADTSDGIFVYGTSPDVNVGDHVRVRGTVDEYYGLTEITSVSQVWSCGTGSVAPTPLLLPVVAVGDFEAYEGMLVTFPQDLVISEYFNFDRYGEIVLATDRQFQPTAVYDPGSPEAAQLTLDNMLGRVIIDDGRDSQNPDPAIHPNGLVFDLTNLFRGGDTVTNMTGVMDYNFGAYKVQPTQGADYVSANPRTESPDDVGDSNVKVASFNVLNYFTTIDTGDWICGPSGDMECRGADTTEEYERQRAKIIAALATIDADVVGLIEIENYPGDMPTADLVSGLNDELGPGTYDYIVTGAIGTDAIRQAFIYKPATVTPVGDYAVLDSTVDPRFLDDYNRPALAQTFMDNATGGNFTVAVNHLKSKGSDCNDIGDPDIGDGSGNCNLTRKAAAEALVDWLASDPTGSGDDDFLIIGDLNSYDKEDPIDVLLAGGYTDLIYEYLGEYAYSYVFDGAVGYLDHGLANGALVDRVTGATIWHINADEPDLIDYDMTYKLDAQDAIYAADAYRSSDHDPVIVGLCTDETAPTVEIRLNRDTLWPPRHQYVTVHATVHTDDFDPDPVVELVSVTSSQPDDGLGDGDTSDDIVILNDFTFKLRAERMGGDEDRIYTIIYTVTDDCGNVTIATATVTVPHDMGR